MKKKVVVYFNYRDDFHLELSQGVLDFFLGSEGLEEVRVYHDKYGNLTEKDKFEKDVSINTDFDFVVMSENNEPFRIFGNEEEIQKEHDELEWVKDTRPKAVAYFVSSIEESPEMFYKAIHEVCETEELDLVAIFHDLNREGILFNREDSFSTGAGRFIDFVYEHDERIDIILLPQSHQGIHHDIWEIIFDPYDLLGENIPKVSGMGWWIGKKPSVTNDIDLVLIDEESLPF